MRHSQDKPNGVYILVNKDTQRLFVMNNKRVLEQMLCSTGTGKARYGSDEKQLFSGKTEEGTYTVSGILASSKFPSPFNPHRHPYGPWMFDFEENQFKAFGKALHGTDEPRKLGRRASAGCIRVSNVNVKILKRKYVRPGTKVYVIGSPE